MNHIAACILRSCKLAIWIHWVWWGHKDKMRGFRGSYNTNSLGVSKIADWDLLDSEGSWDNQTIHRSGILYSEINIQTCRLWDNPYYIVISLSVQKIPYYPNGDKMSHTLAWVWPHLLQVSSAYFNSGWRFVSGSSSARWDIDTKYLFEQLN